VAAEQVGRVGHLAQPVVALLEADHLVGRAVAVLDRPQQPQRGVLVALEGQHRVDHVLHGARSGDGVLAGGLADQQHRHPTGLGDPHQHLGDLLHLAHAAGPAVDGGGRHRLDAVDDEQHRVVGLDVAEQAREVGLLRRSTPGAVAPMRRARTLICSTLSSPDT
jgi:hypothetical protein